MAGAGAHAPAPGGGLNPVAAAVSRPYTVAVAVILTVLFSLLAAQRIPIQLKPTVDTPQINVVTTYRGAGAIEVEDQITRELEDVLQTVEGLVEMTSESLTGRSNITLEFEPGTNTRLALIDVINKLSRVPSLPEEADEPRVDVASSDESQPVMWVAVEGGYGANRIRRVVEDEVEPRIERIPGVSSLLKVGGSEREVKVLIDPQKLIAHGVDLDALSSAIRRGNLNVRGGTVETDSRQLVVRTVGKPEVVAELREIVVKQTPGGRVRLGDVADVLDDYAETTSFVSVSGRQGVALGIRRQVGANVVQLIRQVDAALDELNSSFERRGLKISLKPVYRETTYIDAALTFVTNNLLVGAALAVVVLLLFLRSPRSVAVVSLAIPISMVGVFLVLAGAGRSLNVISLAGIAFASGMAVDNAIVVLENIFRHLEMGKGRLQAAIDGGLEMWGGVLASTLTTIAVFVPIILQQDEASQLFRDMALTISSVVALSLLVALSVVPVLASLLFREAPSGAVSGAEEPGGEAALGPLGRAYDRFCALLARPGGAPAKLGFTLLIVALSLASLRLAPSAEYLPTGNRNLILFFAAPIAGTRPEATRENFKPLEEWLLSKDEVDRTFCVIADRFNGGGAVLREELATGPGLDAFHKRMFGPTSQMAGFRYVVPVRASLFQDPGKQFEVELSGPDFDVLESASAQLQQRVGGVPGVQFVRSSLVTGNPELVVELDEAKAKEVGLDVAYVGQVVEMVVAGRRLSTLTDGGREVDVNVLASQDTISSAEALKALRFLTRDGREVALASVAEVKQTTGPESVRHLERERNVLLTVNILPDAPLEAVVEQVERDVLVPMSAELGGAYRLSVGGSADKLRTTIEALTSGFWLSVLIVYLLLVSLFRSWVTPGVILVTVPLALTGGLIGIRIAHTLSGGQAAFDVIAMLGFVILAGLVVNNAILIVHQANNFEEEGIDPRRALAESARSRLRPILMSVVTTVAGMLPLAIGGGAGAELYQGLGAIIVGGLVVSTVFTLFLVPVLLSLGHDLRGLVGEAPPTEPAPEPEPA
ncbi:MAG TPA: acriflavin resistance protein [Planctomycetes bacterium]|nr:acriflavin resistance protein [Planctomycetota bacterium]